MSPSEALSGWRRRLKTFSQNKLPLHRRLAFAAIGAGCALLLISWRFSGPAYLKDEIGYLANAAFLAGRTIDAASSYHAGYSLFIAPAFWLSDPALAWKAVLAINAILWAASFVMLHSILRRLLPKASSSNLLTATIVSALYPTWVVSSGYAFASAAFVAVFLASILALFVWSPNRPLSVLPHSALAGYLYWVHPTGAAVALASLLAFSFDAYRRRDARPLCLHVVLIATLFIGYRWGIHNWITGSMTPLGYQPKFHYPSLTSALQTVLTWQGFAVFVAVLVGQLAYLIVASFGMAFAGITFCIRQFANLGNRRRGAVDPGARLVWLYIGAAPLWVVALGAISFFQWDHFEGDFWIYGRYVDGVILPLLAIGLAVFQADIRFAVLSIALLAAGVLLDVMAPSSVQHNIVNTVSFWPQYLAKGSGFFVWMLLGAIAVAAVARFGRKLAAVGLTAAAFPLAIYHQVIWHEWILTNFSAPSSLVGIIRGSVPPGTCVGFDPSLPADATFYQTERYQLNSFYLFNYSYRRMSPAEWMEQCDGPYLTYDASSLLASGRARLVAREIKSNLLLVQRSDRPAMTIPKDASPDIEVGP